MVGAGFMSDPKPFLDLLSEFGRQAGLEVVPDESGSAFVEYDDGLFLHFVNAGDDAFVAFADTGIELTTLSKEVLADLAEICLKINFLTTLSSRLSVAATPEGTMAMTFSGNVSRTDSFELLKSTENLVDKARALRDLIREMVTESTQLSDVSDPADLLGKMGRFA